MSTATVSRVLSHTDYPVSQRIREQVIQTAREMGYVYRGYERKAVSNGRIIGIIVPNITNAYYAQLVEGIQEVAIDNGYQTIVLSSYRNLNVEKENVELLIRLHVKGIILIGMDSSYEHIQQAENLGIHVITLEQKVDIHATHVGFNYYNAGQMAADHLFQMGHRSIGYISAPLHYSSRIQLYEGFVHGLTKHDITLDANNVCIIDHATDSDQYEFSIAQQAIQKLTSHGLHVTAAFCANDMLAIGAIQSLKALDYNVPDDISIMGFDHILMGQVIDPSLTTIDQCTREMSALACYTIIRIIEKNQDLKINTILEPTLIEGDSIRRVVDRP